MDLKQQLNGGRGADDQARVSPRRCGMEGQVYELMGKWLSHEEDSQQQCDELVAMNDEMNAALAEIKGAQLERGGVDHKECAATEIRHHVACNSLLHEELDLLRQQESMKDDSIRHLREKLAALSREKADVDRQMDTLEREGQRLAARLDELEKTGGVTSPPPTFEVDELRQKHRTASALVAEWEQKVVQMRTAPVARVRPYDPLLSGDITERLRYIAKLKSDVTSRVPVSQYHRLQKVAEAYRALLQELPEEARRTPPRRGAWEGLTSPPPDPNPSPTGGAVARHGRASGPVSPPLIPPPADRTRTRSPHRHGPSGGFAPPAQTRTVSPSAPTYPEVRHSREVSPPSPPVQRNILDHAYPDADPLAATLPAVGAGVPALQLQRRASPRRSTTPPGARTLARGWRGGRGGSPRHNSSRGGDEGWGGDRDGRREGGYHDDGDRHRYRDRDFDRGDLGRHEHHNGSSRGHARTRGAGDDDPAGGRGGGGVPQAPPGGDDHGHDAPTRRSGGVNGDEKTRQQRLLSRTEKLLSLTSRIVAPSSPQRGGRHSDHDGRRGGEGGDHDRDRWPPSTNDHDHARTDEVHSAKFSPRRKPKPKKEPVLRRVDKPAAHETRDDRDAYGGVDGGGGDGEDESMSSTRDLPSGWKALPTATIEGGSFSWERSTANGNGIGEGLESTADLLDKSATSEGPAMSKPRLFFSDAQFAGGGKAPPSSAAAAPDAGGARNPQPAFSAKQQPLQTQGDQRRPPKPPLGGGSRGGGGEGKPTLLVDTSMRSEWTHESQDGGGAAANRSGAHSPRHAAFAAATTQAASLNEQKVPAGDADDEDSSEHAGSEHLDTTMPDEVDPPVYIHQDLASGPRGVSGSGVGDAVPGVPTSAYGSFRSKPGTATLSTSAGRADGWDLLTDEPSPRILPHLRSAGGERDTAGAAGTGHRLLTAADASRLGAGRTTTNAHTAPSSGPPTLKASQGGPGSGMRKGTAHGGGGKAAPSGVFSAYTASSVAPSIGGACAPSELDPLPSPTGGQSNVGAGVKYQYPSFSLGDALKGRLKGANARSSVGSGKALPSAIVDAAAQATAAEPPVSASAPARPGPQYPPKPSGVVSLPNGNALPALQVQPHTEMQTQTQPPADAGVELLTATTAGTGTGTGSVYGRGTPPPPAPGQRPAITPPRPRPGAESAPPPAAVHVVDLDATQPADVQPQPPPPASSMPHAASAAGPYPLQPQLDVYAGAGAAAPPVPVHAVQMQSTTTATPSGFMPSLQPHVQLPPGGPMPMPAAQPPPPPVGGGALVQSWAGYPPPHPLAPVPHTAGPADPPPFSPVSPSQRPPDPLGIRSAPRPSHAAQHSERVERKLRQGSSLKTPVSPTHAPPLAQAAATAAASAPPAIPQPSAAAGPPASQPLPYHTPPNSPWLRDGSAAAAKLAALAAANTRASGGGHTSSATAAGTAAQQRPPPPVPAAAMASQAVQVASAVGAQQGPAASMAPPVHAGSSYSSSQVDAYFARSDGAPRHPSGEGDAVDTAVRRASAGVGALPAHPPSDVDGGGPAFTSGPERTERPADFSVDHIGRLVDVLSQGAPALRSHHQQMRVAPADPVSAAADALPRSASPGKESGLRLTPGHLREVTLVQFENLTVTFKRNPLTHRNFCARLDMNARRITLYSKNNAKAPHLSIPYDDVEHVDRAPHGLQVQVHYADGSATVEATSTEKLSTIVHLMTDKALTGSIALECLRYCTIVQFDNVKALGTTAFPLPTACRVRVEPNFLILTADGNETALRWSAVHRVESNKPTLKVVGSDGATALVPHTHGQFDVLALVLSLHADVQHRS